MSPYPLKRTCLEDASPKMPLVIFATRSWKIQCMPFGDVRWSRKYGGKVNFVGVSPSRPICNIQ